MKIGQYLKDARLKKGLTQEELALQTDISIRTIQRIEGGEVDPRSHTLHALASALDLEFESLLSSEIEELDINNKSQQDKLWLVLLHLSGILIFIFPPLIIWLTVGKNNKEFRTHAIDVMNFQISMFIYFAISGIAVLILIGLPVVIFLGIFSNIVIIINTVKVATDNPYKYPWSMKILKH